MKRAFCLCAALFALEHTAEAQQATVSPYSRYGLGEYLTPSLVQGMLMGNTGVALRNPYGLNLANPASANAHALTTIEMAFRAGTVTQKAAESPQVEHGTALFNYFAIGIPVSKRYGFIAGFLPYTAVGYQNSETQSLNGENVTYRYEGEGGINEAFISQSLGFFSNRLHLGLKASYLFGSVDYNQRVDFSHPGTLNSFFRRNYVLSDWNYSAGLQYIQPIGQSELTAGIVWDNASNLSGNYSELAYTFSGSSPNFQGRDTLSATETQVDLVFPGSIRAGLGWAKKHPDILQNAYGFTLDYERTDASNFIGFNGPQPLGIGQRISVGMELIPAYTFGPSVRNRSYLAQITYRAGFQLTESPLTLKGIRIDSEMWSAGASLPLRTKSSIPGEQRQSFVHLGVQWLDRGTIDAGLIREESVQFIFGVTLSDKWFIKYKYR